LDRSASSSLKPFLKWAGGKRQLLPDIRGHLPPDIANRTYYEPFVGAGAVLFDLRPEKAFINDSNAELILTYRVIRYYIEEIIAALAIHREKYCTDWYYAVRDQDRDAESYRKMGDVEKAARLIFLNKTCYNGLYRVNSRGCFNVPFGRYENPLICDEPLLRLVHRYLHGAEIVFTHDDFAETVKKPDPLAFVYFDPPYHSPDKGNFTAYQAGAFGEAEQLRLRDAYLELSGQGIPCLLSNADTPFIRKIYGGRGLNIHGVLAKRAINSNPKGRGVTGEVLITNWH
jgi:DNA adenine methylase